MFRNPNRRLDVVFSSLESRDQAGKWRCPEEITKRHGPFVVISHQSHFKLIAGGLLQAFEAAKVDGEAACCCSVGGSASLASSNRRASAASREVRSSE